MHLRIQTMHAEWWYGPKTAHIANNPHVMYARRASIWVCIHGTAVFFLSCSIGRYVKVRDFFKNTFFCPKILFFALKNTFFCRRRLASLIYHPHLRFGRYMSYCPEGSQYYLNIGITSSEYLALSDLNLVYFAGFWVKSFEGNHRMWPVFGMG